MLGNKKSAGSKNKDSKTLEKIKKKAMFNWSILKKETAHNLVMCKQGLSVIGDKRETR